MRDVDGNVMHGVEVLVEPPHRSNRRGSSLQRHKLFASSLYTSIETKNPPLPLLTLPQQIDSCSASSSLRYQSRRLCSHHHSQGETSGPHSPAAHTQSTLALALSARTAFATRISGSFGGPLRGIPRGRSGSDGEGRQTCTMLLSPKCMNPSGVRN
eukprot:481784-Hanusia_phi.AAC.4